MLKAAVAVAVVLATASTAFGQELRRINTCFEEYLAALQLSQLEQGIAHCDQIADDMAAPSERRGQAFAQRGLMHARQWAILGRTAYATQGIADITEAFRLHTPSKERKHHLLLIRAQLHVAVGQTRRAAADYAAVLSEDQSNAAARRGQHRLGPAEGL
jgi:hypothetical protein